MAKRKLKIETRYAYLLRDAKIMTAMLWLAAQRLEQLGRGHASEKVLAMSINAEFTYTASDVRDLASERNRLAYQNGRGRGTKQR